MLYILSSLCSIKFQNVSQKEEYKRYTCLSQFRRDYLLEFAYLCLEWLKLEEESHVAAGVVSDNDVDEAVYEFLGLGKCSDR